MTKGMALSMNLKSILINVAPEMRPCSIKNIETINEIKNKSSLNEMDLITELNRIPHVSTIGGTNCLESIELDKHFPTQK